MGRILRESKRTLGLYDCIAGSTYSPLVNARDFVYVEFTLGVEYRKILSITPLDHKRNIGLCDLCSALIVSQSVRQAYQLKHIIISTIILSILYEY